MIRVMTAVSVLIGVELLEAQVTPTNQWVDFYGDAVTNDGTPVAVGKVVKAYDPDGVLCGEFTIGTAGSYGFLHVYRDDPTTTEDEGAVENDEISFTIFSAVAYVGGPDNNTWTSNGDSWEVDLQSSLGLDNEHQLPSEYVLQRNFPNPFNPTTVIRYEIPEQSRVVMTILDILGRRIATLDNSIQDAGYKSVVWDGSNELGKQVASGVYLYRIEAGEFTQTRKMILMR